MTGQLESLLPPRNRYVSVAHVQTATVLLHAGSNAAAAPRVCFIRRGQHAVRRLVVNAGLARDLASAAVMSKHAKRVLARGVHAQLCDEVAELLR